ncbi:MAG: 23S rRNA (uracil(1939)-C(5))-methyltransferase RlmD [Candidatus Wallbacteria bacterium HGW-Wallbacteria-1]|jgi:23S rRNA (uracil1939-C5)-methyltransferase|uniref:23S rRNA (Uracil(1939)-C(5))-methyltransferase RlmD n=1 Tax=Candidatus Wallbacteria bacterium HGW-Wallbacteria-1 TaxID=2013854 RepID=A0A2N1PQR8_9BACT|nr:MAG: 23S rRNA (uracil(1939)-C(5))-methyltransferase RlmD [Candidatus Wallbacteria bacterium HGW-Wallbacteria-1]
MKSKNETPKISGNSIPSAAVAQVTDLTWRGEGLCRINGRVAFVKGAVPGDTVKVNISEGKKGILECTILETLEQSSLRKVPPCKFYQACGGCQIMSIDYSSQLKIKVSHLNEAMTRIGGFKNVDSLLAESIHGMDSPWHYRNKGIFQFSGSPEKPVAGLFAQGSRNVTPIDDCLIQRGPVKACLEALKTMLIKGNEVNSSKVIPGVDIKRVLIRNSTATNELLVEAVLGKETPSWLENAILDSLMQMDIPPDSIYISFQANDDQWTGIPEKHLLIYGKPFITERIGKMSFHIGPDTFFQINPDQASVLLDEVSRGLDECKLLSRSSILLDLFCGVGFFGLSLADKYLRVSAIEANPSSIAEGMANAKANRVENIRFMEGDASTVVKNLGLQGILGINQREAFKAAENMTVLLDPPRAGCGQEIMQAIASMEPAGIVMVSCNPSTLARDCQILSRRGYKLKFLSCVDMFPHTMHLESAAVMRR